MSFESYLKIGKKTTEYTDVKRGRVSAIAFTKNGHIITKAHNQKTPGNKSQWTIHAEENLLKKLIKINAFHRFGDIIILVMRFSSNGVSMAKPCMNCMKQLRKYNVSVFYTGEDGQILEIKDE